jgi:hypothetical protein
MRIHDVKRGKNRFCGPAALSSITGRPVDEIVATFHACYPGKKVMGTHAWELHKVLEQYALYMVGTTVGAKWTLARWLREMKKHRTPGKVFLIIAGRHWMVVSGRRIVCGKVKTVMSVREYPHRRARVTGAWMIGGKVRAGVPKITQTYLSEKAKKKQAQVKLSSGVAAVMREAQKHGISVEKENDYWIVWPPEWVSEDADPFEGDYIAWNAGDIEYAVNEYLKLKTGPSPV